LRGLYLEESVATTTPIRSIGFWPGGDFVGRMAQAEIVLDWGQASDECRLVAGRILASTDSLDTWQRWNDFCDSLLLPGAPAAAQAKRDLLKANFNPNSDLNKFNPNRSLWRSVDKIDLLAYSAEFSLLGVHDQEVTSVGRILGPGGRVLAERRVGALLSGPSLIRIGTQREFVCEDLGNPDEVGDETGTRLPGYRAPGASEFVTESAGLGRTWGHRLDTSASYPGTWTDGKSRGTGLQTYPAPCVDCGSGLDINPAFYDGNLQLATVETPAEDWYEVDLINPAPPLLDMKCLARFDDTFDLDLHDGPSGANQPDIEQRATSDLWRDLFDPTVPPGTLYPDGCYSEKDRAPTYLDLGNADGFHGVLSFWVKRNYDFKQAVFRGRTFVKWTNISPHSHQVSPYEDQAFIFCDGVGPWGGVSQTLFFELGHSVYDVDSEFSFSVFDTRSYEVVPARRWSLETLHWDFRTPSGHANELGKVVADAGVPGTCQSYASSYSLAFDSFPTNASDITAPDRFGAHRIILGNRVLAGEEVFPLTPMNMGSGADATFDEFAVYDFGGAGPLGVPPVPAGTLQSPVTLAGNRFKEGRYYKGWKYNPTRIGPMPTFLADEAASFFTPLISLPPGARLRRVAWTWYRPKELPDDYAEVALVTPDGLGYLWGAPGSRSTQACGWQVDRQDCVFDRIPGAPFRAQVVFRRLTPLGGTGPGDESQVLNTPLLDSPVLDDLSFLYEPAEGSRITAWRGAGQRE
jgi:hypothetical protein